MGECVACRSLGRFSCLGAGFSSQGARPPTRPHTAPPGPFFFQFAHQMQPSAPPNPSANSLPQSLPPNDAASPSQQVPMTHADAKTDAIDAHARAYARSVVDALAADTVSNLGTTPSQKDFAIALGVSQARISQLVKIGMPLHSISAAKEWRSKRQRTSDDAADSADAAAVADDEAGSFTSTRAPGAPDQAPQLQRGALGIHVGASAGMALGANAQAALLDHYGAAGAGFNMLSALNRAGGGGGRMFGAVGGGMRLDASAADTGARRRRTLHRVPSHALSCSDRKPTGDSAANRQQRGV